MTIGMAVAALILVYLCKFQIVVIIGVLLSLSLIGGVLWWAWIASYPDVDHTVDMFK